jgi:tRNA threonylcarbamoyladenosine biosynthesis protein TsaB
LKLLALDTSSLSCSVALQDSGDVNFRYAEEARGHTRLLVPMIRTVLDEAGVTIGDLDAIVLGNGPGSFIGMRIATSVAQGLAHAAAIPVVPVSSMACVALQAAGTGGVVAVAQDAHMSEVYLGVYAVSGDGVVETLVDERLQAQDVVPELAGFDGLIAAGAGWQRYPHLLELNRGNVASVSTELFPHASSLVALGSGLVSTQAIPPEEVVPAYLRQKVAQSPARTEP